MRKIFLSCFGLFIATTAFSQNEPVDKNTGGLLLGTQFSIGQSSTAGNSAPGPSWLLGVEAGYGVRRDTWNRIELGLEFDKGSASFEDKVQKIDATVDIGFLALIKVGYGYSLGDHAFGLLRLGGGIAQASYEGRKNGSNFSGGQDSGVATLLAWDAIFPMKDNLDLNFGFSLRTVHFKFDEVTGSSFQLNIPAIYGGARLRL